MEKVKGLPPNVKISLGQSLRAHYDPATRSIPIELWELAQKTKVVGERPSGTPSAFAHDVTIPATKGLDPETVAILETAFSRAWNDLDYLTANPTTHRMLVARLLELLDKGERDPLQLATKAVLGLVAPRTDIDKDVTA